MANDDPYSVERTSLVTWAIEPIVLRETGTTRLVLVPKVVDNPNDVDARLEVRLRHERKRQSGSWEAAEHFSVGELKAGQFVQLHLDTATTKLLATELLRLRALSSERLPSGDSEFRVVDARSTILPPQVADAIKEVLGEYSEPDLATAILREFPTLAQGIAFRQQLQMRRRGLDLFKEHLDKGDGDEGSWQKFLQREEWILGFGAVHQFLTPVAPKPVVSPPGVSGAGAQFSDYLMATAAISRFTVLVEIKKPTTELLHGSPYRTGVFHPSRELSGAVAQVQTQIHEFEASARAAPNVRELEVERGVYTFRPRAVLVVGNTAQLSDFERRRSFELYRRQVVSPDIVTYDELLYRAELMLNSAAGALSGAS